MKKLDERNVHFCIYHVEMEKLLHAFNHLRTNSRIHANDECTCQCEVYLSEIGLGYYIVGSFVYLGLMAISEEVLCLKRANAKWN